MASSIRVLFLNHTAKLGGGELALRLLIGHLDKRKVDHQVLLFEDGPLVELLRQNTTVHTVRLSSDINDARKDNLLTFGVMKKLGGIPISILRLRSAIRRLNVDVVHTNSLKADILGGIAARLAGKRVVWHVRDRISPDYLPGKVVIAFRQLARWIPHAIITNSMSTLQSLLLPAQGSSGARLAHVIHDGVDRSIISFTTLPQQSSLVVGIVGRLSPWKGQDVFLRAVYQIYREFESVRFVILGSALFGEEEYERHIRDLSKQLGLDECVQFCGFVTNVAEWIATFDILVHASTIDEPFGQVVIEGMAAGKPVIATRGGGVSEIVEEGVSGLLVPMKDATALAQAIRLLLTDPARRAELGSAGRQRVQEKFLVEYTAEKVVRLYEELAAAS